VFSTIAANDRLCFEPAALDLSDRLLGCTCDLIAAQPPNGVRSPGDDANTYFATSDGVFLRLAVSILDDHPEKAIVLEYILAYGAAVGACQLVNAYVVVGDAVLGDLAARRS
jgi:hypothetical protein